MRYMALIYTDEAKNPGQGTPEWEKLVAAGKWKDYPGYGRARKGRIGLQDHGNKVWFRDIKVRVIPARG